MIGNVLDSRKVLVILIDQGCVNPDEIRLSSSELENGVEIESKIVENLKNRHDQYYANHKTG